VVSRRGIATRAGFDGYFSLVPLSTEIPQALVDAFVASLDHQYKLHELMLEALARKDEAGNTKIGDFFQELEHRFSLREAPPTQAALNATVNIGEIVEKIDWRGDILTPSASLHFLTKTLLKAFPESSRGQAVRDALAQCTNITSKAAFFVDRARESGVIPSDSTIDPIVSAADLKIVGADLAPEIRRAALNGELDDSAQFFDVMHIWTRFGEAEDARKWLANLACSSGKRLAVITKGIIGFSRSGRERLYEMYERPNTNLYDLHALKDAATKFRHDPELSDDERARITALHSGLERIMSQAAESSAPVE
jgi:hypothetical protein